MISFDGEVAVLKPFSQASENWEVSFVTIID